MSDLTRDVIAEMLRENTGESFLDSGGTPVYDENGCYIGSKNGYGRAYERNRCRNFEEEPETSYKFAVYGDRVELSGSKKVFHLLNNNFEYDEEWQKIFDDFCENYPDDSWLTCMYKFGDWLKEIYPEAGFGPYGDSPEPLVIYTYNMENTLDHNLQFMEITVPEEGDSFVLIQAHLGCDARGGLTAPRVFTENGFCDLPLHFVGDVYVCCSKNSNHSWSSESAGYSFSWSGYSDDYSSEMAPLLDTVLSDEDKNSLAESRMGEIKDLFEYFSSEVEAETDNEIHSEWTKGKFLVDDDGNGFCPICGYKLNIY